MLCPDNSAGGGARSIAISIWARTRYESHGVSNQCSVHARCVDLSQIVTLVSHKYVKALRHGIYEHDYCAKAISDWVRSRLAAQ